MENDLLEPDDMDEYEHTKLCKIKNECKPKSNEWVLFPKEIAANQLKQEGGTCYFVSAIESLSHIPQMLDYLFPDAKNFSSYNDTFTVQFYGMKDKNQVQPTIYAINNDFPINNKSGLEFMKPLENEAYAIILEKAWAAIRGGYNKIKGGRAFKVLNKLFGTKCKCIFNEKMEVLTNKYKEQEEQIIKEIENKKPEKKKDPEDIIDEIKTAFKTTCPIITTSINMEDGGHEYSILGTYSEKDPKHSNRTQEFIILKNPWRTGAPDKEKEKMNESEINAIVNSYKNIKKINDKYKDTGVFYMPKEYFKKWFRDVTICEPNYKDNFPKVYNSRNLYDVVNEYYEYNSNQNYFDIIQGNRLIKVNIISKDNFEETKTKITIITPDHCFIRKKGDTKYTLIENPDHFDFEGYDYYVPNITFKEKEDKCVCVTELKKINSESEYYENINEEENKDYLENKDIKENDKFKEDFKQIQELNDEVQEFLQGKDERYYPINRIHIGWVNMFEGITLCGKEKSDGHYHRHNLKNFDENNLLQSLFDCIGKQYKCSCYYLKNGTNKKNCDEDFKFENGVFIYNYETTIDQKHISASVDNVYFFNIRQSKQFFTNLK